MTRSRQTLGTHLLAIVELVFESILFEADGDLLVGPKANLGMGFCPREWCRAALSVSQTWRCHWYGQEGQRVIVENKSHNIQSGTDFSYVPATRGVGARRKDIMLLPAGGRYIRYLCMPLSGSIRRRCKSRLPYWIVAHRSVSFFRNRDAKSSTPADPPPNNLRATLLSLRSSPETWSTTAQSQNKLW